MTVSLGFAGRPYFNDAEGIGVVGPMSSGCNGGSFGGYEAGTREWAFGAEDPDVVEYLVGGEGYLVTLRACLE